MVVADKRQRAQQLIEQFLSCEIDNEAFDDGFPVDDRDPAFAAIHDNLWMYYSESYTHKLEGKDTLPPAARNLFVCSAAFLGTNLEYEWPVRKWISIKYALLRLLGLGKLIDQECKDFDRRGDFDVWPFIRRAEYQRFAQDLSTPTSYRAEPI